MTQGLHWLHYMLMPTCHGGGPSARAGRRGARGRRNEVAVDTLAQPPGNCVSSLILDLLKPQCNAAILLRTEVN